MFDRRCQGYEAAGYTILLPDFAQPYRVVSSPTVQAGSNGGQARPEV